MSYQHFPNSKQSVAPRRPSIRRSRLDRDLRRADDTEMLRQDFFGGEEPTTLVEARSRHIKEAQGDRRRKWMGRAAVAAIIPAAIASVWAFNRATDQQDAEQRADAGNIPELIQERQTQNAAVDAHQAGEIK